MDERPAASPAKLLSQFEDWTAGNEMPGRTMSYLKTGFLPDVLEDAKAAEGVEEMLDAWQKWEKGITNPEAVLEALRDAGLETVLASLSAS